MVIEKKLTRVVFWTEQFPKSNGKAILHLPIDSKINGTPKGVCLPISKLHSILAVTNLLAHNNISQICYCGQISLQSAAVNCSFLTIWHLCEYHFFLLVMVRNIVFHFIDIKA